MKLHAAALPEALAVLAAVPAAVLVAVLVARPAGAQTALTTPAAAAQAKGGHGVALQPPAAAASAPATVEHRTLPPAVQALLAEINAYRAAGASCGQRGTFAPATPLAWNDALERAAAGHVRDMAQRQDVVHAGSDGSNVSQRVERQGYVWTTVGENVAAGRATASATLAQWMSSPGHCANLMGTGFKDVAVASQQLPGSRYGWYWVMVLAASR